MKLSEYFENIYIETMFKDMYFESLDEDEYGFINPIFELVYDIWQVIQDYEEFVRYGR